MSADLLDDDEAEDTVLLPLHVLEAAVEGEGFTFTRPNAAVLTIRVLITKRMAEKITTHALKSGAAGRHSKPLLCMILSEEEDAALTQEERAELRTLIEL